MHHQELFGCRQNKTGGKRSALLSIRVCVCASYGAKTFIFLLYFYFWMSCRAYFLNICFLTKNAYPSTCWHHLMHAQQVVLWLGVPEWFTTKPGCDGRAARVEQFFGMCG